MPELERRYQELGLPDGRQLKGVVVRYGDVAYIPGLGKEMFQAGAFNPIGDVRLNLPARTGANPCKN